MKKIIIINGILSLLASNVYAQEGGGAAKWLLSASSPKGNYIYLTNPANLEKDSALIANTAYFKVEKILYDSVNIGKSKLQYTNAGIEQCVQRASDLKNYFTDADIQSLKDFLKLKTNDQLVSFMKTHKRAEDYSLFYHSIELRRALGLVFLDKEVNEGDPYLYKITRVDNNKNQYDWGIAIVQSKFGNYALAVMKPYLHDVLATDSSVKITWKLMINQDSINDIPRPSSKFIHDKGGLATGVSFYGKSLRARLNFFDGTKWLQDVAILPQISSDGDTLTFIYYKKCIREENITAYITGEDEVYNQGAPSDTVNTFAISDKHVPLIYGINVTEVLNGIRLAWKPLPEKPYIAGIQVVRYDSQDKIDTLGLLSGQDTVYTDYAIAVGQHYRYKVKVVFLPGLAIEQKAPAEGVGTFTKFSHPLPPYNLTAANEQSNVRLTWEAEPEPGFFGYYVYRGTNPRKLSLIAGPVKTTSYVDTSHSLSGRSQYYYAVINQNLRQDTSMWSNIASIIPNKPVDIQAPSAVSFYYANGKLKIMWDDVRKRDNSASYYTVERKRSSDSIFSTIATNIEASSIFDSLLQPGAAVAYKVHAYAKDSSSQAVSDVFTFTLPKPTVAQVSIFYLRTISSGVEVSMPAIVYSNRNNYNIYRRKASETSLKKIGSMPATQFTYVDKEITPGEVYVYGISITESDGREGAVSKGLSIKVK